jgi:hypothetical protein
MNPTDAHSSGNPFFVVGAGARLAISLGTRADPLLFVEFLIGEVGGGGGGGG